MLGFFSVLVLLLCVGCRQATPTPEPTATGLTGQLTFAGSTTLQPLAHEIGGAFTEEHPDVILDIAAGGSVVGIEAVHDGTVDIGMASRALKPEEAEGIQQHQAAADVIAMVVHESNPVEDVSLEDLRDVYLGKITNWRDVGGEDAPILVVIRGRNSGTRGAFDEIVLDGADPAAPNLETAVAASDVAALVAENANAIGYIGFGHFDLEIKVIAIDSVMPSEETVCDGSYLVVRPLLFLTGPLTQPLAYDFIDFALGERGQAIVVDNGWVPAN
jgi:phosphate transport system substrate-binding protein